MLLAGQLELAEVADASASGLRAEQVRRVPAGPEADARGDDHRRHLRGVLTSALDIMLITWAALEAMSSAIRPVCSRERL